MQNVLRHENTNGSLIVWLIGLKITESKIRSLAGLLEAKLILNGPSLRPIKAVEPMSRDDLIMSNYQNIFILTKVQR